MCMKQIRVFSYVAVALSLLMFNISCGEEAAPAAKPAEKKADAPATKTGTTITEVSSAEAKKTAR